MANPSNLAPLREFPIEKPVIYVPIPPPPLNCWEVPEGKVFKEQVVQRLRYEYAFSQGDPHVYRMTGVEE